MSQNKQLREEIDHLRREKSVFDDLCKQLTKKLESIKQETQDVIDQATLAYEQRWVFCLKIGLKLIQNFLCPFPTQFISMCQCDHFHTILHKPFSYRCRIGVNPPLGATKVRYCVTRKSTAFFSLLLDFSEETNLWGLHETLNSLTLAANPVPK